MAEQKIFTLPEGQKLTSKIATNLYLYSQDTTPTGNELLNTNLIRPEFDPDSIPDKETNILDLPSDLTLVNAFVDAEPYMSSSGSGRFANGSQFDLVRAFFKLGKNEMLTDEGQAHLVENKVLSPGTYTKEDINRLLFQGNVEGKGLRGFSSGIELRNYQDNINDYNELVYLWNSSAFSLPSTVQFVVNPDLTREIQNFRIEPNAFPDLKFKENFDFATASLLVELGSGSILEPRVDPSKIGRTVFIDFYNRGNLPLYDPNSNGTSANVYKQDDFDLDVAKEISTFKNVSKLKVRDAAVAEAEKLFDAGVTKFLYQNKPVVYGTVGDDNLNANEVEKATLGFDKFPLQKELKDNGIVLLGGQGADAIKGDKNEDILIGHEGDDVLDGDDNKDILIGDEGDDILDGGSGNQDVAVFSDNFENYDYSISGGIFGFGGTITFTHSRGTQTDGTDTLKNIEWAEFANETVSVPIGNQRTLASATTSPPRILPLPLEDGVKDTEAVKAIDTTASPNPNDRPTPPHVSLTMPVEMLDGNVDYTLNISPYKPDTQYNISYIFDTSASMDAPDRTSSKMPRINKPKKQIDYYYRNL